MNFSINKIEHKPIKKIHLQKIIFKEKNNTPQHKTTFRFFKNKNIIEANKQNLDLNPLPQTQKPRQQSFRKTHGKLTISSCKRTLKTQRQSMRSSQRFSFVPVQEKSTIFSPKIKQQIIKRHKDYRQTHNVNRLTIDSGINNIFYQDKQGLQKLLNKNKLYGSRCLVGMNIPKIQQTYSFSRFQLFNLYTYYKTLLQSTNRSVVQLRKGFQSILYINKIELNSQMVDTMFEDFFKDISFHNFIKVYGNIQNLLFTQTIIEFMISVFSQFYRQEWIHADKVLETLKQKVDQGQAFEIRNMLMDHFSRKQQQDIESLSLEYKYLQEDIQCYEQAAYKWRRYQQEMIDCFKQYQQVDQVATMYQDILFDQQFEQIFKQIFFYK